MPILLYLALFLQTAALGYVFTAVARRVAPRIGWMDRPGGRKDHAAPKAVLGGAAVFAALIVGVGFDAMLATQIAPRFPALNGVLPMPLANVRFAQRELMAILGGASIVFVLGLIDDKRPLPPGLKLMAQFAAAGMLLWGGVYVRGFLPTPLGMGLTVLWVVFLTNAFNFLDNMDGLCSGVALIVLLIFAAACAATGQWLMVAIFVALAGAVCGFLPHNWNPSTIFIGDAGALTLGFLIAALSVHATYYTRGLPTTLPVLMPIVICGVPVFDSLSVYAIRLWQRRPLMVGDKSHFSHRLLALGMSVKQAALFIYLVTAAIGLSALPLRRLPWPEAILHGAVVGMFLGIIGFLEYLGARAGRRNSSS